jgi:hypothetical protein
MISRATGESEDRLRFIYYASPVYVDYLYRACVSPIGQRTLTKETITKAGASAEAGLAKLLTVIADLKAKGTLDLQRSKGETLQVQETVSDRAGALFDLLYPKLPAVNENSDGLCSYSLPTRLAAKRSGDDAVIEVCCSSEQLSLSAVTSDKHWPSASLKNNLLMAAAKAKDRTVPTRGLLFPLHSELIEGRKTMQVQFIVIASPHFES